MSNGTTMYKAVPRYRQGTRPILVGRYRNRQGALADPDDPKLYVRPPDGQVQEYEPAQMDNVSVGVYEFELDAAEPGEWRFRFACTEPFAAAGEDRLIIEASGVV